MSDVFLIIYCRHSIHTNMPKNHAQFHCLAHTHTSAGSLTCVFGGQLKVQVWMFPRRIEDALRLNRSGPIWRCSRLHTTTVYQQFVWMCPGPHWITVYSTDILCFNGIMYSFGANNVQWQQATTTTNRISWPRPQGQKILRKPWEICCYEYVNLLLWFSLENS